MDACTIRSHWLFIIPSSIFFSKLFKMHFLGKMRPRFVKSILVCASYNLRIYSYPKWGHSSLHFTLYHYLLLHVLSLTFRGLESSDFCQLMYLKLGFRICWHQSRSPRQIFTLFFLKFNNSVSNFWYQET